MWIESFIARLTKRALKLDIYMSVANKTEKDPLIGMDT